MKRILVTGGFGFVGSHLIEELLIEPNNLVHVIDNLSTSPLPYERLLKEINPPDRLTYEICTVQDYRQQSFDKPVDEIYHLASVVGPAGVLPFMGRIIHSIVEDTYQLIELAQHHRARLLDVSTSEIYGGGQNGLCSEALPKIVPAKSSARLEYAVGKLAAEVALQNFSQVNSLDVVIIRPFNISGPRQSGKGGFVLPRFVAQALQGQDLTVFGNGKQIRAFTHVKNIASGLIQAMKQGHSGEAYNLGNSENKCTILELAQHVISISGSNSEIKFVDPKVIYGVLYEEANDKYPDATKANLELGWTPSRSLTKTVSEVINYMKNLPPDLFNLLAGA
jgi:UDP-glucose 4-epimerase